MGAGGIGGAMVEMVDQTTEIRVETATRYTALCPICEERFTSDKSKENAVQHARECMKTGIAMKHSFRIGEEVMTHLGPEEVKARIEVVYYERRSHTPLYIVAIKTAPEGQYLGQYVRPVKDVFKVIPGSMPVIQS